MKTKTATNHRRFIEWLGTLDIERDGQNKIVAATFKKKELRTTSERGQVISDTDIEVLNRGLLERPGTFHTIWVENTEKNRSYDPIKLDITAY